MKIDNDAIAYPAKSLFGPALSNTVSSMAMSAYSGGYPFSISGDIRSVPS